MISIEQQARDLLGRLGVDDAQDYSCGDLVELAELIHDTKLPPVWADELDHEIDALQTVVTLRDGSCPHFGKLRKLAHIIRVGGRCAIGNCDSWRGHSSDLHSIGAQSFQSAQHSVLHRLQQRQTVELLAHLAELREARVGVHEPVAPTPQV